MTRVEGARVWLAKLKAELLAAHERAGLSTTQGDCIDRQKGT